ncbi:MAG: bifunctional phosphoglucose/phosphomannose isomerase [Candidatus Bathyarchaeota archaeon]|nr:bifunctional phosphoglucose/phosphomannose isomerase [Candidatus Bathyarchaeota archaeon]
MSRTEAEILDDKEAILVLDRSGLFKDEFDFPQNLRKAVANVKAFRLPESVRVGRRTIRYKNVENIVLAGMGGSAIVGDVLKDWVGHEITVPMETVRGYHLPAYLNEKSLVFFISYSGNTEETLSCMYDAVKKGCQIVSISSNGALARVAQTLGFPLIELPEMAAARASLPYLFAPLPYLLAEVGILSMRRVEREMSDAIDVVDKLAGELAIRVSKEKNLAKKVALEIYGTVPIVYCYNPYKSVGLRFKDQVNENCKLPARCDVFPELNHNEIMGWEAPESILKRYTLVLLRDLEIEPLEVKARIDALKEKFFLQKAKSVIEMDPQGKTPLGKIFSLMFTLDVISMYLAVLHGRNPVASETFQILKYEVTERLGTLRILEKQMLKLAST